MDQWKYKRLIRRVVRDRTVSVPSVSALRDMYLPTVSFFVVLSPRFIAPLFTATSVHPFTGTLYFTATECVPCAAGHFLPRDADECEPCPIGTYQEEHAQTGCNPCDRSSTTQQTGAHNSSLCICESLIKVLRFQRSSMSSIQTMAIQYLFWVGIH